MIVKSLEYHSGKLTNITNNGIMTNIEYDNYGNIIQTHLASITYNDRNLMEAYKINDHEVYTFDYNYQGNRYKKQKEAEYTVNYYLDGSKMIGEDVVDTHQQIIRKFRYFYDEEGICGINYIIGDEDHYFNLIKDPLGNISKVMYRGKMIGEYIYDGWGNCEVKELSISNDIDRCVLYYNPFRYKGYYYDVETNLYYCQTRYYSPELCRFIQPAEVTTLNPSSINGLNLYSYANNNPIGIAYSSACVGGTSSGGMAGSASGTFSTIGGSVISGTKISGFGSLGESSLGSINWPKANSVVMTHYTTSLIENAFIGSFFGNISYTVTTQLNDSEMFYSYSNVGNGGYSAGIGMNLGNWYGISAYVSSNIGFGTSMQLTPWITYGAEISLQDGISFSFGTISGNTTQEITANVGWGTIAGAYLVCAGIAAIPMPGARVLAGAAACVILLIDIFN
ncbi:MAG: RHS repeat-associated core domain-containing protein [Prevotella sp.]|nr:RHS repeat-associated core domain-containing protein [Staphylococcus sp.]MCM1350693.1 RHS repeat-associated core domain-containing protein [Prevotella sp.]